MGAAILTLASQLVLYAIRYQIIHCVPDRGETIYDYAHSILGDLREEGRAIVLEPNMHVYLRDPRPIPIVKSHSSLI